MPLHSLDGIVCFGKIGCSPYFIEKIDAEQQLRDAAAWYQQEAPHVADAWFNGFVTAIASLEVLPRRCGLAPESESFPFELRQLLLTARATLFAPSLVCSSS
ncbi:MAG: hypothetical protein R3C28_32760 [Pirellulaceae bacterium]